MPYEIIGALSGLINVWLTTRENIWCWPMGILYILASYKVFFAAQLYAELLSHTVYLVLTLYGWYLWSSGSQKTGPLHISKLSSQQILFLSIINIIFGLLLGYLFANFTNNPYPYLDAMLAILSFTGTWLSAKKKIENWALWGVINFLSIGMYYSRGIYLYAGLYLLYFVLAIYGHHLWKRKILLS